ncbi:MAG: hypothetical protein U5Q44_10905 [Dehalococcoidia bacterium]|nr:hypothetical protein [Dehalococcoidia bacterium]
MAREAARRVLPGAELQRRQPQARREQRQRQALPPQRVQQRRAADLGRRQQRAAEEEVDEQPARRVRVGRIAELRQHARDHLQRDQEHAHDARHEEHLPALHLHARLRTRQHAVEIDPQAAGGDPAQHGHEIGAPQRADAPRHELPLPPVGREQHRRQQQRRHQRPALQPARDPLRDLERVALQ